ncbi:nuclease-related domain-containing protein [Beggiatoa leptomitoformis]|uniref:Nuclease n=1 Tax=Beggiatoa leptomitoformis TaxID=288004 RepID=A0A2N9YH80_9GAMM|nr:NERD domain-containing protein [Beggiatoa leptomitoformis]ALG68127.2 nuclease [Beggiatoa leptomitoformis]AUI69576.2 nuclease [Beggiatoa leptomitoformis]
MAFFLLFAVINFLKSAFFKGITGEAQVNSAIRCHLDKKSYFLIKNITLPIDSRTTQIDHLIVSPFGIFVIETKNMRGNIYGKEEDKLWTQQLNKTHYTFQNPLHQNYKHVKTLETLLDIDIKKLHSLIVFIGKSTFKTPMPKNVTQGIAFIDFIRRKKTRCFTDTEITDILHRIENSRLSPSLKTHRNHIKNIDALKTEKPTAMNCPICGNIMILRTTQQGKAQGKQFWGCSHFPTCKTIVNIS